MQPMCSVRPSSARCCPWRCRLPRLVEDRHSTWLMMTLRRRVMDFCLDTSLACCLLCVRNSSSQWLHCRHPATAPPSSARRARSLDCTFSDASPNEPPLRIALRRRRRRLPPHLALSFRLQLHPERPERRRMQSPRRSPAGCPCCWRAQPPSRKRSPRRQGAAGSSYMT